MTKNKRLRYLIEQNKFPDSEDGLPKTTKIVAVKFYKGRAYYRKKYLREELELDNPNRESNPL